MDCQERMGPRAGSGRNDLGWDRQWARAAGGKPMERSGERLELPREVCARVFLDRQGTLWVSTEDTLVFLPPGARRFQPTGIRVGEVTQIAQAANGKLWMAETTRSVRPIPLSDKRQPPDETEVRVGSMGILFDNDEALWITSMATDFDALQLPSCCGVGSRNSAARSSHSPPKMD